MSGNVGKFGQLRHKDQNRQGIDKADNNRAGNEAHQVGDLQVTQQDLNDARQQGGGKGGI
jgi:hypothetical protein